jgi:alpha-beta hydrolase superfamily lysophospholipase
LPEGDIDEIIIGIHGFTGDKESSVLTRLSSEFNKIGKALICFDLPCHGENDNTYPLNLNECVNAIKTIFDYVKTQYKGVPISVFATSFGGYLILNYLSKNDEELHKLILRAPAIYMYEALVNAILTEHNLTIEDFNKPIDLGNERPILIDNKFIKDVKDSKLEHARTTNHFIYILQGKKDDIVNYKDNDKFFTQHYPNRHKVIYFENADHRFKKPGELDKIVLETLAILNDET